MRSHRNLGFVCLLSILNLVSSPFGPRAARVSAAEAPAVAAARSFGIPGGLCVQLGTDHVRFVTELARSGRFLVHLLGRSQESVLDVRADLSAAGLHGVVSADRLAESDHLPYTENLVNLLVLHGELPAALPGRELKRVLTPGGALLVPAAKLKIGQLEALGFEDVKTVQLGSAGWLAARKPWPPGMDEWSHPRHSASANPVSRDLLVGPPRRIRWLAGPWREINNMVTASGRLYYAGLLARDAFNGLRLWEEALSPSPASGGFGARRAAGAVAPVAGEGLLFVYTSSKIRALDGATGEQLHEYPTRDEPREILYQGGTLLVVGKSLIEAFDVDTSALEWSHKSSDPRAVVVGDGLVAFLHGNARRGEEVEVTAVDQVSGETRWHRDDLEWLPRATNCAYHKGKLAFEVSSFSDHSPGNSLHVLSARDGTTLFDHEFPPAMSHYRQARAIFVGDDVWILHGGRVETSATDAEGKPVTTSESQTPRLSSIDFLTGNVQRTLEAGLAHCFPPVATERFFISGEMDFTNLRTGQVNANRITKAACGRDGGWVPANGLLYVAPKHCVCWPMLRGYAALAPARPGGNPANEELDKIDFPLLEGEVEAPAEASASEDGVDEWPCYRHDAWRSASTTAPGPQALKTLWSSDLGRVQPGGPLGRDWSENPFADGPVTPPVIAGGKVFVARPDAQQVVALDATSGKVSWRFTASGRIDTAPTLHRGLCLFGSRSGYVYCLRAADGKLVWRLRAAPLDERIVAYGQLESPWPVPGSVLIVDDVAYFAAGRQSLADGGVFVFAIDPTSGGRRWVKRLDSVPQKGFYNSSGLEFDNFDLLHRQGDGVAMARWVFDRQDGAMSVAPWQAYAKLNTGRAAAWVPQGSWSYAPRHMPRTREYTRERPLVAFRDNLLVGSLQGMRSTFRRDFHLEQGEKFDTKWMTGWTLGAESRDGKSPWQADRLARKATWTATVFGAENSEGGSRPGRVGALVLAGERHFLASTDGELQVRATADGKLLDQCPIPTPLWDGLAVVGTRLYLSTQDGGVLCIGE